MTNKGYVQPGKNPGIFYGWFMVAVSWVMILLTGSVAVSIFFVCNDCHFHSPRRWSTLAPLHFSSVVWFRLVHHRPSCCRTGCWLIWQVTDGNNIGDGNVMSYTGYGDRCVCGWRDFWFNRQLRAGFLIQGPLEFLAAIFALFVKQKSLQ